MTIIILVFYGIFIGFLIYGWLKQTKAIGSEFESSHHCSILIAARNEATTLPLLLADLQNQEFDMQMVDIVIIDDHSTDDTVEQINTCIGNLPISIHSLPNNLQGKKAAIAFGMNQVKNQAVLFLDADCRINPQWLRGMMLCKEQHNAALTFGIVQFTTKAHNWWHTVMELEFATLVASGGAMAALGRPIFCNAANMLVDKTSYLSAQNYIATNGSSGDDVFLLHHLKRLKKKILFCKNPQTKVFTNPPETFTALLQQRLRWAAKSRRYKDFDSIVISALVFLNNFWPFIMTLLMPLNYFSWKDIALFYGIKTVLDLLFFITIASSFSLWRKIWIVPFMSIFYTLYIVSVAILAMFLRPQWKGRKIEV